MKITFEIDNADVKAFREAINKGLRDYKKTEPWFDPALKNRYDTRYRLLVAVRRGLRRAEREVKGG